MSRKTSPLRKALPWVTAGVVAVVGFGGTFLASYFFHKPEKVAEAADWELEGEACPMLTEAEFKAKNLTAKKTSDFGGSTFGRTAGHIECRLIASNGGAGVSSDPLCRFTSPATVVVTAPGGKTHYFYPGIGKPATVAVRGKDVSCVLASNFKL